ncbi:redoxin domain-containing protein [Ferruginibacter sp.]
MIKKIAFIIVCCCFSAALSAQHIAKLKMADVVDIFSKKSDTTYVINFWATFCKPCVAEIPGFIKVANKYKKDKVKLLLVSLDLPSFYPTKVATFATKNNFKTNIGWLDETNADYFCPLIDKSWSGTIPATIIVNANTGYKKFWEGDVNEKQFETELKTAIADTKASLTNPVFLMPMNKVVAIDYFDKENSNREFKNGENAAVTFKSNDSTVFALSDGIVTAVAKVDEMKVIIIRRGKIFYTYSNLGTTLVKKGDKVSKNQKLGYAALDFDKNIPTMDFYLNNDADRIYLTRNNFIEREKSTTRFSVMLGIEPE